MDCNITWPNVGELMFWAVFIGVWSALLMATMAATFEATRRLVEFVSYKFHKWRTRE
jgi:hypothetical protein